MGVRGGTVIGMDIALESPDSDMSGEMVMPDSEEVKGPREVSDR